MGLGDEFGFWPHLLGSMLFFALAGLTWDWLRNGDYGGYRYASEMPGAVLAARAAGSLGLVILSIIGVSYTAHALYLDPAVPHLDFEGPQGIAWWALACLKFACYAGAYLGAGFCGMFASAIYRQLRATFS